MKMYINIIYNNNKRKKLNFQKQENNLLSIKHGQYSHMEIYVCKKY